jgi:hypothetical protein
VHIKTIVYLYLLSYMFRFEFGFCSDEKHGSEPGNYRRHSWFSFFFIDDATDVLAFKLRDQKFPQTIQAI